MPRLTMREVETPAFEDLQWLGTFARRLARDPDEAEELVQETLVTAWSHPPQQWAGIRPWLATVARNRLRMQRRGEARRRAREATHGPVPSEAMDPDAAVARVRVLNVLTAELERLEPEDQELIVRRFLDGQSAADIARALSLPAGTVRSRISRLLGRLRERLDERCDGRNAWCAAVLAVPLAGPAGPIATTASTRGTNTMLKTALIISLTTAAGATAWVGFHDSDETQLDSVPEAATPVVVEDAASVIAAASETKSETKSEPKPESGANAQAVEKRWKETKEQLAAALKTTPPVDDPTTKASTRKDYAMLIVRCVRDIENQPAEFSVKLTEVGAPDIGTIVSEVEVVGTSVDNPEVVECAEQSMYAYIGEPPSEPFERTHRFGMQMSARKAKPEHEGKVLEYQMNKKWEDIRACETGGVKGFVEVEVSVAFENPSPTKVALIESTVEEDVTDCIIDTVRSWKHFNAFEPETRRHRYTLPMQPPKTAR